MERESGSVSDICWSGAASIPLGQKIEAVEKTGELSPSGVASSGSVNYASMWLIADRRVRADQGFAP